MSKSTSLSRAGKYTYKDLKETGSVVLDLWVMEDPPFSYDADACDVLDVGREVNLVFGQTAVGMPGLVTAVVIAIAKDAIRAILATFAQIDEKIDGMGFSDEEIEQYRVDLKHMPHSSGDFRRERAQVVRAICTDDMAVMDFYLRPPVSMAMIEANPKKRIELTPVIRLTCHPGVVSLMLRRLGEIMGVTE